ncbi:MAG: helix-turn-helix transcriptional regulator [Clostridia bacterium]|nr:helix-turn-helix transcriptional regulator [Clostridia bacterium]
MKNKFDISDFVNVETSQAVKCNLVERVKQRRKEKGFSQQELASRSGVSYASIRRFESKGDISLSSLLKIANAIGCLSDFNQLFKNPIFSNLEDLFND